MKAERAVAIEWFLFALWERWSLVLVMHTRSLRWSHDFLSDGHWIPSGPVVTSLHHIRGRDYKQPSLEVPSFPHTCICSLVFCCKANNDLKKMLISFFSIVFVD